MADDNTQTPPWGDDFDPERAWKLILALRGEKADLQEKLSTANAEIETERQARTEAETKATAAEESVTEQTARADKAEGDLHVERAIRKHNVPDDLVEFLTGTPEEIEAKAERLSKIGQPAAKPEGEEDGNKPDPADAGRPKPDLTPGHGGDTSTPVDTDAVVAAIRGTK